MRLVRRSSQSGLALAGSCSPGSAAALRPPARAHARRTRRTYRRTGRYGPLGRLRRARGRDRRRLRLRELWNTATRGLWRFGEQTTRVCTEGPSTGSGISPVATSGQRVFWVTLRRRELPRRSTLWTATRRRGADAAPPRRRTATSTRASRRSCSERARARAFPTPSGTTSRYVADERRAAVPRHRPAAPFACSRRGPGRARARRRRARGRQRRRALEDAAARSHGHLRPGRR